MQKYDYFLAVVNERSFSKASEKMYISQPSLSKQIRRLEEELGCSLFDRSRRPVELTEAGKIFYEYVREKIAKRKQLKRDLQLTGSLSGAIKVGTTLWRSSVIFPGVLPQFKEKYPNIEVEILEGSHKELNYLLRVNKVDFIVCHESGLEDDIQFIFEKIIDEKVMFCVRKDHPVLKHISPAQESLTSRDIQLFQDYSFILLKPEQHITKMTLKYLSHMGIAPQLEFRTENIITALKSAKRSNAVTFAPQLSKQDFPDIRYFTINDPPLSWVIGHAYLRSNKIMPLANLLMKDISNSMREEVLKL